MGRAMLNEANLMDTFWKEALQTIVYIQNRDIIRFNSGKNPYELWFGRPASVKHFKVFGSKCYIKRDAEDLGSFESRCDEGIFLGYSSQRKAYKLYNKRLHKIVESVHVRLMKVKIRVSLAKII